MTTLTEVSSFDTVYQLETTDPVTGGPGGVANRQAQQLANRTKYLLDKFSSPVALADGSTATTQPKFDKDTSVATTAFVKAAGVQHSGTVQYSASGDLLAGAVAGNLIIAYLNTGPISFKLPASATCDNGTTISFFNSSAFDLTLVRDGSDTINLSGVNINSVVIKSGETLSLSFFAQSSTWECFGGSAQLAALASFGQSLATNGFKKLPGGMIIQWGTVTPSSYPTPGTLQNTPFNFPIAFPNAGLSFVGTLRAGNGGASYSNLSIETPSNTGAVMVYACGNVNNPSMSYIAIGY